MALTVQEHGRRHALAFIAALLLFLITGLSAQSDTAAARADAASLASGPGIFNGTGNFAPEPHTLLLSGAPSALGAADLNGDGYTDLAVVHARTGVVEVFLNTKRQTFTSSGLYAADSSSARIACADLNGDGLDDIVTAGGSVVSVLLNAGSGRFAPAASFEAGPSVSSVAIGDVDNDGTPDIAVTNASANTLTILKNDGRGSFSLPRETIDVEWAPSGAALADLNNDGRTDAVVCNRGSNSVSVLLNAGGALPALDSAYAVHTAPSAIVVCDFDCDGFLDIAAANSVTNDVTILLNDREGRFAVFGDFGIAGSNPSSLCAGDFDADGDIDLAAACMESNTITIMQNNGYAPPSIKVLPAGISPQQIAAFNMSGNYGIIDIASANASDGTVSLLKNTFYAPPPPELTLSADTVNFPEAAVNRSSPSAIMLSASLSPLTIDSVTVSSGIFTASMRLPIAIPSFGSVELPLAFHPRAIRSYAETILIHSSAGTRQLRVSGASPVPEVLLSTSEIPYGNVKERKSSVKTIVLKNPSLNDVVLDSAWTRTKWFAHSAPRRRIAHGDSLAITLRFSPDTLRAFADTLRLLTNTNRRLIAVALSGNSPVPTALLSAQSIQFGNVRLGDTARASLIVSNQCFNDVVIDTIYGCSPRFRASRLKGRVAQGDSLTFTISFIPSSFKAYADTLRLRTNSDRRLISVIVWGRSPSPLLLASAQTVDFMKAEMKQSVSKRVVLTNRSLNSVTIDSVTLRTRRFRAEIGRLPLRLHMDDTVGVRLTFTPDSTFRYADTLFVHSSMLDAPLAIALVGEGDLSASDKRRQTGIPDSYSISQNFPNPFRGLTSIQFAVPQPSYVVIRIYDVTGREIAEVFNNTVSAGFHTAQWNASGVSSGIYFYRIRAGSLESGAAYNDTRKLVILK